MSDDSAYQEERKVTRTFRAAIRLGDDYITLEESITLPLDSSDEDIAQAVDMGWRIYNRQLESLESQVAGVRESHVAPAPGEIAASERQRNYIAVLQKDLAWNDDQLADYADEQGIDVATMNRNQASSLIDMLRTLCEERVSYPLPSSNPPHKIREAPASYSTEEPQPMPRSEQKSSSLFGKVTDLQYRALERLAHARQLDLDDETRHRFGLSATEISSKQAAELIQDWQR